MSSASQLLALSRENATMIALAESCTGGLIAAALTDLAGSSAMFDRGFVTYTNAAKIQMLGVSAQTLSDHGAVSEQVAAQMAQGALTRSDATIALSVTGIAGPGGSDHKPEGRVCFGVATSDGTITQTRDFGALGRAQVRQATVNHALTLLIQTASSQK
ncbi:CinA family protein [Loktanella sp. SALINAS62]|uniref:CinA family protein n=1 Tax=Loktanella sp. SALINAS62 TaxID=2706124 RepID=UPI001B8A9BD0|nr:CinA family protein [Loktanella sp. SALINAS62]MBS1303627.1 CinA family protein [Loktanella sp. SALINAS62]